MAKIRLTYGEVQAIVNSGMLNASARTLPTRERYNVFDLKQQLREALKKIEDRGKELLRECGIEDAAAFDARNEQLRGKVKDGSITGEEQKELDGNRAKLETYFAQRNEMHNDTVKMEVRPIGCEAWFALRDENAAVKGEDGKERDLIPDWAEAILFGKFWTAPEDAPEQPETTE